MVQIETFLNKRPYLFPLFVAVALIVQHLLIWEALLSQSFSDEKLLDFFFKWDGPYYRDIAENGYDLPTPFPVIDGIPQKAAFFPLYPLITGFLSKLTGIRIEVVMIGLTYSCFVLGLYIWLMLIRARWGTYIALATAWLTALYPWGYFFSAPYTEGPMILLSGVAFTLYSNNKLGPAFLVAGITAALRPTGFCLGLALSLDLFLKNRKIALKFVALSLLSISGLLLHFAYLWAKFDNPMTYSFIQSKSFGPGKPLPMWERLTGLFLWIQTPHGITALAATFVLLAPPKDLPRSWILFTYFLVGLALWGMGPIAYSGTGRHLLPLVPFFLILAQRLAPRPQMLLMTLMLFGFWLNRLSIEAFMNRYIG